MSLTAHVLAQRGSTSLARCAGPLCSRVFASTFTSTSWPRPAVHNYHGRSMGFSPALAADQKRSFSHSLVRLKKAGKEAKKDKKSKTSTSSTSSTSSPSDDDDAGANHPLADAADPFNFADVESRWQRSDTHHEEKLRELQRALGDGDGAVDVDAIGAIPVRDSKDAKAVPLAQLALVIPRAGGRFVELRMHSATSRKALVSAVSASPLFRGQQPQPDPDDELVLLIRLGTPHAEDGRDGAANETADRVRRVRDLANAWRAQIRRATARRQKTHQTWKKDGSVRPDDLHRLDRDLLRGQEKRLARIDTAEKEAVRQVERNRR